MTICNIAVDDNYTDDDLDDDEDDVNGGILLNQDSMWQVNLRPTEAMENSALYPSAPYPEHEGEPDCSFYLRTGLCRFGSTCRFNHPPNRNLALAAVRMKGEFPERVGQPECQYYLKTGSCKFGATCKFHHPKDKAGIAGLVPVNILGYPLRPNDPECAYYLRTGQCKFGSTCKFHHPQPSSSSSSLRGSSLYPSLQSSTIPGGGMMNLPFSRASLIQSPRWQGPSSYAPLVLPQGIVSVPTWNAYMGQMGSISSEAHQFQTASQVANSTFRSGSMPIGYYGLTGENDFPERPGQPECQYYLKTGDCKFGAVCRFHHPRERLLPTPDCLLSSLGLPLRPGEPLCIFYSRYGICKFGPNCKFDHPMGIPAYNLSPGATSSVRRYLGSSSTSGDGLIVDPGPVNTNRLTLSETSRDMPSGNNENTETEV